MQILESFIASVPASIEQGLIYGVLALGIYNTYTVLDFPDLSVDGSFPLGGVVSTAMLLKGTSPVLSLLASAAAGALAGLATGLIHVNLKVRDLFSGVIVMTALYSVNLRIAGGKSLITIPRNTATLFRRNLVANTLPDSVDTLLIALIIVIILKLIMDLFLKLALACC